MKKFILFLIFPLLMSFTIPCEKKPSYVSTTSTIILKITLDEEIFNFKVYEKEVIDANTICLYGKSKHNCIDKIIMTPKQIKVYTANKVIVINDARLYNSLQEHLKEVPNYK
jgi:hypothetical protein